MPFLPEDVLHFIEEGRGALGRLVFHFHRLAKLFEQFPLIPRHFRRGHDTHAQVEIALASVWIRQAVALLPENLPGLRAFRYLKILFAFQRGYAYLRAERRLRKAHWNRAYQIGPAPLEERVLL